MNEFCEPLDTQKEFKIVLALLSPLPFLSATSFLPCAHLQVLG